MHAIITSRVCPKIRSTQSHQSFESRRRRFESRTFTRSAVRIKNTMTSPLIDEKIYLLKKIIIWVIVTKRSFFHCVFGLYTLLQNLPHV
uniref:Uncharacterized protein n=1 Tax=Trichogramma kaykai TaxID=54128 RepID=A0ABD2WP27_9HYME